MHGDCEIDIVIQTYVAGYFADMCNELNRGDKFQWANFPYKAASRALHGLDVAGIEYHEDTCYNKALEYANRLVHRAGL